MFCRILQRGAGGVLSKTIATGGTATKCISAASIHVSATQNDAIGDLIQTLRFKYYHDPRHHLDYDKWAKIFTVEGNIKSGKGAFAKEFAEKLDLRYFPIADYTFEITAPERQASEEELNFLMHPDSLFMKSKNMSLEKFYQHPEDWAHTGRYQAQLTKMRFYQYADAYCHLVRTGQGCVLERSFYAVDVFEHALKKMKLVPKNVSNFLANLRIKQQVPLIPPQVVIHLDVPAEKCYENIQKKGTPVEKEHVSLEYLKAIEEGYDKIYSGWDTEWWRRGSKIIEYDWSKPQNIDDVIFDMDDMPTLLHEYSEWREIRNKHLKNKLYLLSDEFVLHKLAYYFCDVEELWDPDWLDVATANYNESNKTLLPGYDHRKDKWLWLKSIRRNDKPAYRKWLSILFGSGS